MKDSVPSFSILSNRCVHLGCPTQPQRSPGEPRTIETGGGPVELTPTNPSGYGCPCHGGAYDVEGNRTAGPPVRALDRYEYSIVEGRLVLGSPYSVAEVDGEGADAVIVHAAPPTRASTWTALSSTSTRTCREEPLMAQAKAKPQHRLLHAVMVPLDWLEERSGFVGATKYFLFRKVPRDSDWFHTLGSATLTAFIVQAVTGVVLAFYYKPSPNEAYSSIQFITNDLTLGWLVRGMHRWGASVFIILLFLHMGRVFLFGAYKYPRELNWLLGVMLLVLAMLEGFTGYLLPWDQTAYWATVVGINLNATAPFLGPFLSDFLREVRRSAPTPSRSSTRCTCCSYPAV